MLCRKPIPAIAYESHPSTENPQEQRKLSRQENGTFFFFHLSIIDLSKNISDDRCAALH